MNRGTSAAARKQRPPTASAASPTTSVRRERRSGSRRWRQAMNHSNPGCNIGWTLVALWAEEGEEDYVADGRLIGEQHGQAIDPDPLPRRRRQPVLQRPAIVLVVVHRLVA